MHALIALAQASEPWSADAGLTLGLAGWRPSNGQHHLEPALGGWVRWGEPFFVQGELMGLSDVEPIPGGEIRTTLVRGSAVVGWRGGTQAPQVGFAAGPAMTVLVGGVDPVVLARPGLRICTDIRAPLGDRLVLGGSAGFTTRGRSADVDLSLNAGFRW